MENGLARGARAAHFLAIATDEGMVSSLAESGRGFVVLDRTPFYAESGGQVGDTGQLKSSDGSEAEVDDTQAPVPGLIVHFVHVLNGTLQAGELDIAFLTWLSARFR